MHEYYIHIDITYIYIKYIATFVCGATIVAPPVSLRYTRCLTIGTWRCEKLEARVIYTHIMNYAAHLCMQKATTYSTNMLEYTQMKIM